MVLPAAGVDGSLATAVRPSSSGWASSPTPVPSPNPETPNEMPNPSMSPVTGAGTLTGAAITAGETTLGTGALDSSTTAVPVACAGAPVQVNVLAAIVPTPTSSDQTCNGVLEPAVSPATIVATSVIPDGGVAIVEATPATT